MSSTTTQTRRTQPARRTHRTGRRTPLAPQRRATQATPRTRPVAAPYVDHLGRAGRRPTAPGAVHLPVADVRASRPQPQARRSAPVRLTRRGRWVLCTLLLVSVLGVSLALAGGSIATGDAGAPVPTRTVVVSEGESLWTIASSVAAPGETRDVMLEIEQLNHLDTTALTEGQRLLVPAAR